MRRNAFCRRRRGVDRDVVRRLRLRRSLRLLRALARARRVEDAPSDASQVRTQRGRGGSCEEQEDLAAALHFCVLLSCDRWVTSAGS